jgi:hypothetical protein
MGSGIGEALTQGHECVVSAGQRHAVSARRQEQALQVVRGCQCNRLFEGARQANGARIPPAMASVDHNEWLGHRKGRSCSGLVSMLAPVALCDHSGPAAMDGAGHVFGESCQGYVMPRRPGSVHCDWLVAGAMVRSLTCPAGMT